MAVIIQQAWHKSITAEPWLFPSWVVAVSIYRILNAASFPTRSLPDGSPSFGGDAENRAGSGLDGIEPPSHASHSISISGGMFLDAVSITPAVVSMLPALIISVVTGGATAAEEDASHLERLTGLDPSPASYRVVPSTVGDDTIRSGVGVVEPIRSATAAFPSFLASPFNSSNVRSDSSSVIASC